MVTITASPGLSTVWSQPSSVSIAAVGPADARRAEGARLAAFEAVRRHRAVRGEDGAVHLLEEADRALGAAAGRPLALAAGAFADVEILEEHREAELEDLRIGQARVGHVGVDAVGAVEAGAVVEAGRPARRSRSSRSTGSGRCRR